MNIKRKLELLQGSITSIGTHDDEDAAVRLAALDQAEAMIKAEREGIEARVQARIDASLG